MSMKDLTKYFDLITGDVSNLSIRAVNSFNCVLIDKDGNEYCGFLLAKSERGLAHTLCDISFQKSATDNKYQPRLIFRKVDNKLEDKSHPLSDICKVRIPFQYGQEGYREFWKMIAFLYKFKDLVDLGDFKESYALVDPKKVIITDQNHATYINILLAAGYDQEVWESLVESNPSLITKLSYSRIQNHKRHIIENLKERLKNNTYSETTGDDSWQIWIYRNNWLFGVNYQNPISKAKINISGVMPDFLFPTVDGFIDVLEIKLPNDDVLVADTSHQGAWKWSKELNEALGQVINYLGEIDRLRLELEKKIKIDDGRELSFLKPRAFILIGDSSSWASTKKEALRKMNHSLHGIEILTYKELIDRGIQAVEFKFR